MNNALHLYNKNSGRKQISLYDFHLAVLEKLLPKPLTIRHNLTPDHRRQSQHTIELSDTREK